MNIIILAAGSGTRMLSSKPKVLQTLAGKTLLSHIIDTIDVISPKNVFVVYGYGGEAIPAYFSKFKNKIKFIKQEPLLGTGHAVLQVAPYLNDKFPSLVLYGDVPLISYKTLQELYLKSIPNKIALITALLEDPNGYGRIFRSNGKVKKIIEQKDTSGSELKIKEVNTGIFISPTKELKKWLENLNNKNSQNEYYLTDVISQAEQNSVVIETVKPNNDWEILGINSKSDLIKLERIYQKHLAEKLLKQGVKISDPLRLDIRGELVCGSDVFIDVNCVFEGIVKLSDNVIVEPNCIVINSEINENTTIKSFSHIEGAVIGSNGKIGPFARVRSGTTTTSSVNIGNFVEIKNSKIDSESKVNHLSYVGDSQIGKRVNVGAGTITCNYDGAFKHTTIVEDDVFIGSDSQLVAPVKIGKGATLGAGTTLTKNAPEGKLTISRSKQSSIDSWKRPKKVKK